MMIILMIRRCPGLSVGPLGRLVSLQCDMRTGDEVTIQILHRRHILLSGAASDHDVTLTLTSDHPQGPRVESAPCSLPACPATPSPSQVVSSAESPATPLPRPTPVYGASPCGCGCTYILHTADSASSPASGDTSRDINIVSGDCHVFPVTWTLKVHYKCS